MRKITLKSLYFCLLLLCLPIAKAVPLIKNNIIGADTKSTSVWLSPKFNHPSPCCDTLPTFTAIDKAISIIFQKPDTELLLPGSKGELSGSKIYLLNLPLNADSLGKELDTIIADIHFAIIKPIGTSVRIQTTIGETINVLAMDDLSDFNDEKLVTLAIPVSRPLLRTQLPISVLIYIERKSNEKEAFVQFDTLDVCLNNETSGVCFDPKGRR